MRRIGKEVVVKRILIGLLAAASIRVGAPAHAAQGPAELMKRPCRPVTIHHLELRLSRQQAAGNELRIKRIERHLWVLLAACGGPRH
jgi:hypothetical protein